MSESGPYFHAWCDDADRFDAFVLALSALSVQGQRCTFKVESFDYSINIYHAGLLVEEAIPLVRAAFTSCTLVDADLNLRLSSGLVVGFSIRACREGYQSRFAYGPLHMAPFERSDLLVRCLDIAVGGGTRSVEVEAAILAIKMQQNLEGLMLGFCASDDRKRVTTGAWTEFENWGAPIKACATYHANAMTVARDLALSWVHLYDGDKTPGVAGMSLEALAARVHAAPPRASISIFKDVRFPREAVLEALSAPPGILLDALEASALPDEEWRAAEPRALESIESAKEGSPMYEANVTSRKHSQFIQRHAPYYVRRLPNGGVLLATHPYRTLWPLYKDALFLLGITP